LFLDRAGFSDQSEIIGKTDRDLYSEEHALAVLADEQKIIETGQPMVGIEEKETWPDGHESWVSTSKVAIRDASGKALSLVIKSDSKISATRLVLVAPLGKGMSSEQLQRAGIATCLVKPVKQSRLFDCLVNQVDLLATKDPVPPLAEIPADPFSLEVDPPLQNVRILLAEDNISNQRIAVGQLRKLGYKADSVANGFEVLEALDRIPYATIIMDCQMPEMDGYLATQEIRNRERSFPDGDSQKSPAYIIAMTADAVKANSEKCLTTGINDFLSKPVRLSELAAALERWKVETAERRTIPAD
jgi:CheY-like chemotaxis protein